MKNNLEIIFHKSKMKDKKNVEKNVDHCFIMLFVMKQNNNSERESYTQSHYLQYKFVIRICNKKNLRLTTKCIPKL